MQEILDAPEMLPGFASSSELPFFRGLLVEGVPGDEAGVIGQNLQLFNGPGEGELVEPVSDFVGDYLLFGIGGEEFAEEGVTGLGQTEGRLG